MSVPLKYINRPVQLERSLYEDAAQWIASKISRYSGIKAFYRFGNITVPGISDLDLLIVFKNNESCLYNGFEELPVHFKPLFTHGIMAVSEDHFFKNHHYTLWSDHILISGEDLTNDFTDSKTADELRELKIQTAIEFLAANYIDLKIQLVYGTINLRSFLQHMKGIIYDLEYLGITSGPVMNLLQELKSVIQHWFIQTPSDKALDIWIRKFDREFDRFCYEVFLAHPMYLPKMDKYQVSRNATLANTDSVSFHHSGTVLPSFLSIFGKKIMRLQNRFNNFRFGFPLKHESSDIIKQRFEFLKEMKSYNRTYLPGFMTITTSITSKII
jgi:hypothetical protein